MRKYPLKKVIDGEDCPEFEVGAYFGKVVIHEKLKGEEGRDVES